MDVDALERLIKKYEEKLDKRPKSRTLQSTLWHLQKAYSLIKNEMNHERTRQQITKRRATIKFK